MGIFFGIITSSIVCLTAYRFIQALNKDNPVEAFAHVFRSTVVVLFIWCSEWVAISLMDIFLGNTDGFILSPVVEVLKTQMLMLPMALSGLIGLITIILLVVDRPVLSSDTPVLGTASLDPLKTNAITPLTTEVNIVAVSCAVCGSLVRGNYLCTYCGQ